MDFSIVLRPLVTALWWLVPLAILAGILRSPWFKGLFGELMVRLLAKFFLKESEYCAIHNVTLPTADETTQIDHIFVSRYGIFVVETKNYTGWIFGGEKQPTWTQKLFKKTYRFQNPLLQNYKHVKALEAALGVPFGKFHSVIVFVGDSTFKTPMPSNVTHVNGFINYIKSKTEAILSSTEMEAIVNGINASRLVPGRVTTRKHILNVASRNDSETPRLRPKCESADGPRNGQAL